MKTIAIYCASLEHGGSTFSNELYWQAYLNLLLLLQARGVQAYFVTDNRTYLGDGVFTRGYTTTQTCRPNELSMVPYITADLVLDRGGFDGNDIPVISPAEVFRLGADKIAMYETFGQYQPSSEVCHNRRQLLAALRRVKTNLAVVKDPLGSGGAGVHIAYPAALRRKLKDSSYPLLVQDFMDTSIGIPGIVAGAHDLRVVLAGGEILSCDVRTPKAGEYRANVAQGGSVRYLPHRHTPAAVTQLARRIDSHFEDAPRFYAIDFAHTAQGWKLIELNAWPGLVPSSYGRENAYTQRKLANYLVSLVNSSTRPAEASREKFAIVGV